MDSPYEGLAPDDEKRWIIVYPAYINARKTIAEGRRVAKATAIDNPTCSEMSDVMTSHGLNVKVEQHKQYPRDWCRDHTYGGRIKVQVFDGDGQPISSDVPRKKDVLTALCERIPKLKARQPGYRGGGAEGGAQAGKGKGKGKRKK